MLDGLAGLAQGGAGIAQVAQSVSFAPPVADLSVDGQGLLVELDSLVELAQLIMSIPQVVQVLSFASLVSDLS